MRQQKRLLLAAVAAACLVVGCFNQPHPLSKDELATLAAELAQTHAADEAAIRAADQDFVKCAEAKDLDKCMSLYADDAVLLASGAPAANGKDSIRKFIQGLIAAPGLKITVNTASVTVAALGDLALDQGTVEEDRLPSNSFSDFRNIRKTPHHVIEPRSIGFIVRNVFY